MSLSKGSALQLTVMQYKCFNLKSLKFVGFMKRKPFASLIQSRHVSTELGPNDCHSVYV